MDKYDIIKRFSGGVGHDINNLLTGIMGFVMLMQEDMDKDSECVGYAEGIRKSAVKLQGLTRKLLKVNNNRKYNRTDIDPRYLLDEAIRHVKEFPEDVDVATNVDLVEGAKVCVDTEKTILALCCILSYLKYRASDAITVRLCGAETAGKDSIAVSGGVSLRFGALKKENIEPAPEDPFDPLYTTASHFLLGCELALAREVFTDQGGNLDTESSDPETFVYNAFLPAE
ncbi:MAG: hypothetical protein GF392_02840 [Candidatus Omnitrophica bacterium]|nr:hypothetical protein [Candidatus Omnitrophota bacterium]